MGISFISKNRGRDVRNNTSIGENNMVIEFDFEIYKNGDYDKVYLRNGKKPKSIM